MPGQISVWGVVRVRGDGVTRSRSILPDRLMLLPVRVPNSPETKLLSCPTLRSLAHRVHTSNVWDDGIVGNRGCADAIV